MSTGQIKKQRSNERKNVWVGVTRFRCTTAKREARMIELLPGDVVLRNARVIRSTDEALALIGAQ